nr:hypothetical protein [uncultured Pseudodesulfovibrio sp.]
MPLPWFEVDTGLRNAKARIVNTVGEFNESKVLTTGMAPLDSYKVEGRTSFYGSKQVYRCQIALQLVFSF